MKKFRQFLVEVAASKRKNMIHLQKMKDVDFVRFIQKVDNELDGKLKDMKVELKVDGLGARFGKDESGRVFFEGSRTGPIFEPKSFSAFAKEHGKTGEILTRAYHYDDILDTFQSADFTYVLPNDTKVFAEIMYNPLAEKHDNKLVFVKTAYDQDKLGSLMTIVPLSVSVASTGEPHPDEDKIIQQLIDESSARIKIMSPTLGLQKGGIDIRGVVDPIRTLDEEAIRILQSRKQVDKKEKLNLRALINRVKDDLADYLINNDKILGTEALGPEKEGIVIEIGGDKYKIQAPEFKARIQKD